MTSTFPSGQQAADLRRCLGPVAWCALESPLERSDDGRTSTSSVRALAVHLGVAKNTAHRAIAVLVRAGLIEAAQTRGTDGRFQSGRYVLHLDGLLDSPPSPVAARRRHRVPSPSTTSQLSLLSGV